MKYKLGFSPCPNDTFIFDALVNGKLDTKGIEFEVFMEDVQTLNEWALEGRLHFSKISYGVLPLLVPDYVVMNSGGALGKGVGPLLISLKESLDVDNMSVAIPGENTTANVLFTLAHPDNQQKVFMRFDEIEDAVLQGHVDAGVIIHENRFTYAERGLVKLMDLGEHWESVTGVPIPLGGIVAQSSLPFPLIAAVDALIAESLAYSLERYPCISPFVADNAQAMEESVMLQHIDLYVNQYSLDLGPDGRKAVMNLMKVAGRQKNGQPVSAENLLFYC